MAAAPTSGTAHGARTDHGARTAHALGTARTLWELLVRRAELTPEAPVLIQAADDPSEDRTVTFGMLRRHAERTAAGLYEEGVRPGHTVAWQLPTRIETVVLSLALARIGARQTPVIPVYGEREVALALRATGAAWYVHPGTWRGTDYAALADRIGARHDLRPRTLTAYDTLPDGDQDRLPEPPDEGTGVRWIYWTSGTTSQPRGVRHTDRSLIAGGSCLAHALRPRPDDVGSIAFPYAHIGGPDYLVMLLLYGFPAVLFERFALPDALAGYRRHGVTTAGGSTAFYTMFLAEQRKQPGEKLIPSLRLLAGGGAAKPAELYHEVVTELECLLTHGYGMTEAPMITMGTPDDTPTHLATTEGRPPAAMDIRITTPDGTPLPPGSEGEVRLRGEAVCQGYLDAAQTAEAFDADGYLITGDLGRVLESGHLVLTGRTKDIIIRKGENISAKEVEQLLYEHPAVADAAVIGLPDAERGERVCAVVEQPPGAPPVALTELTAYLRERGLATYKLPEQVEVVDALPRNEALRKVLKYRLRERFG
ncbi:class I adenylate-forming enzyme family protein [Streptomyces reniochalinae]|uniref:Cyclohexanecarboxylate-CoA ligase n=1 Tax=Streptomyces reniochalinae TaxID=2250578 RepID=A0A367EJU5_9ACTN|nr:AMP-binding protein [Streptomyces reniochalinae]RCG17982.1 cyclohexanecarboxylate-CoA ligase [Streptomyces reniochalinae]